MSSKLMNYIYEPFKKEGHDCKVTDQLSDPVLDVCNQLKYSTLKMLLMKMVVVTNYNSVARFKFCSQLKLDYEKIRQIVFFPYIIHPLSIFRICWESVMILVFLLILLFTPLDTAFLDVDAEGWDDLDGLRIFLSIMSFLDILLNLRTGYQGRLDKEAVLDPRTIVIRYAKTTLIPDIISSIPVKTINAIVTKQDSAILDAFDVFKLWRMYSFMQYLEKMIQRYRIKETTSRMIKVAILAVLYILWVTCLQFTVAYWAEGRRKFIDIGKTITWPTAYNIWNSPTADKFCTGFYRAGIRMISIQGYDEHFPQSVADEIFVSVVFIMSLIFYCLYVATIASSVMGSNSSQSTYYMMVNELSAYMNKTELPKNLKRKIKQYFEIRYNKAYFDETEILRCHAGRLRQDVMMHSCRKVVQDVPFLRNLPVNLLMSIVSNIKLEIFLPNEVIIRADTIGDCMYFIITGIVGVYNLQGRELCRLSDGAHFGELALLGGRGRRRTATVIAVKPCELCRLDQHHFARVAEVYPDLMMALASQAAARLD